MYAKRRTSSRKRGIAPIIVGAAISALASGAGGIMANKKAKKQQKEAERKSRAQMLMEQMQDDKLMLEQGNPEGLDSVEYYAQGGKMSEEEMIMKALDNSTGIPTNGRRTMGGDLVPIGEGVELAVGNKHSENNIDGTYGIKVDNDGDGEEEAEIEDGEVVADGDTVYSDQLMYSKTKSFADKMKEITKKRNKLDEQLETKKDKRGRNTIERKLANLNMAEETLFNEQEMAKMIQGQKTLSDTDNGEPTANLSQYATRTMAKGGKIGPGDGKKSDKKKKAYEEFKSYVEEARQAIGKNDTEALKRLGSFNKAYDSNDLAKDFSELQRLRKEAGLGIGEEAKILFPHVGQQIRGGVNSILGTNLKHGGKIPVMAEGGTFWDSKLGQGVEQYAPALLDNAINFALTSKTPKLATPLLAKRKQLKTDVNVDPQLASIRRSTKAASDAALNNSSSSASARNAIARANLKGAELEAGILGQKENRETDLENANISNSQRVGNINTNTINQNNYNEFRRANEIQSRISANVADVGNDINNAITNNQKMEVQDEILLNSIMADNTGASLRSLTSSPYIQQRMRESETFRQAIEELIANKSINRGVNINDAVLPGGGQYANRNRA